MSEERDTGEELTEELTVEDTEQSDQDESEKVAALTGAIEQLFADENRGAKFSQHSYEIAEHYLDDQILAKWRQLVKEETDA